MDFTGPQPRWLKLISVMMLTFAPFCVTSTSHAGDSATSSASTPATYDLTTRDGVICYIKSSPSGNWPDIVWTKIVEMAGTDPTPLDPSLIQIINSNWFISNSYWDALSPLFQNPNPAIRRTATLLLQTDIGFDPKFWKIIPKLLQDPDTDVRINTTGAISTGTSYLKWTPEVFATIPKLMKDPNSKIRKNVGEGLGSQTRWPAAVKDLFPAALKDSAPEARAAMFTALINQSEWPKGTWELIPGALQDPDPRVQSTAAYAIAQKVHWPQTVWALFPNALKSYSDDTTGAMASALQNQTLWPQAVWDYFPTLLSQKSDTVQSQAQAALGSMKRDWPPSFLDAMLALLQDPKTSKTAALVFQHVPSSPSFWKMILPLLHSSDDTLRESALISFQYKRPWPPEIWSAVLPLLTDTSISTSVRKAAVTALGGPQSWPPEVWKSVPALIENKDTHTEMLASLANVGEMDPDFYKNYLLPHVLAEDPMETDEFGPILYNQLAKDPHPDPDLLKKLEPRLEFETKTLQLPSALRIAGLAHSAMLKPTERSARACELVCQGLFANNDWSKLSQWPLYDTPTSMMEALFYIQAEKVCSHSHAIQDKVIQILFKKPNATDSGLPCPSLDLPFESAEKLHQAFAQILNFDQSNNLDADVDIHYGLVFYSQLLDYLRHTDLLTAAQKIEANQEFVHTQRGMTQVALDLVLNRNGENGAFGSDLNNFGLLSLLGEIYKETPELTSTPKNPDLEGLDKMRPKLEAQIESQIFPELKTNDLESFYIGYNFSDNSLRQYSTSKKQEGAARTSNFLGVLLEMQKVSAEIDGEKPNAEMTSIIQDHLMAKLEEFRRFRKNIANKTVTNVVPHDEKDGDTGGHYFFPNTFTSLNLIRKLLNENPPGPLRAQLEGVENDLIDAVFGLYDWKEKKFADNPYGSSGQTINSLLAGLALVPYANHCTRSQ